MPPMSTRRALIVAAAAPDQLRSIPDRPDLVIAADSGLRAVLGRGWTPDLVVGDLDSADAADVDAAREAGAVVLTAAIDKDETDLELALLAALDADADVIHVVVRADGRLDHQLANVACLAAPHLASAAVSATIGEHDLWVVRGRRILEREPGTHLALLPVGGSASVTSSGVAFPLDAETLSPFAGRGIANEVTEPIVELQVDDGVVLVVSSPATTGAAD